MEAARRVVVAFTLLVLGSGTRPTFGQQPAPARSDLDGFMQQVVARRDDNWKKLQQYILDEQERAELRGPGGMLVFGEQREYTWYVRDGFFVRSPVRINGVAIKDDDRQKYEDAFLKRAQERDTRGQNNATDASAAPATPPSDVQSFISQTREPQFISSAYFLRFKFDPGRYGLVGRERVDNRDVLKIEYYPTKLFTDDPNTRTERRVRQAGSKPSDEAYTAEMQRLMNKVSLVTLWVEPAEHQIVKYTFDNAGLDFLPMAWLVRVADLRASMVMSEAFPGVWLPKHIESTGAVVLAPGRFDMRYTIDYGGYREAKVSTTIRSGAVR
jgi:hypothetical protein